MAGRRRPDENGRFHGGFRRKAEAVDAAAAGLAIRACPRGDRRTGPCLAPRGPGKSLCEQAFDALGEAARLAGRLAVEHAGEVEDEPDGVVEPGAGAPGRLLGELLHERMGRIDLEHGRARGLALAGEELFQAPVEGGGVGDQAGGARRQARRGAHVGDRIAQRLLHQRRERRDLGLGRGVFGLFLEERNGRQIHLALADRAERLAVVADGPHHPEAVHRVGQEQHLDAARAKTFEERARFETGQVLARQIIDLGLVGPHVGDIVLEAAPALAGRVALAGHVALVGETGWGS